MKKEKIHKDYSNIYSVNCATHEIQVFRFHNPVLGGVSESLIREEPYEKVVDIYIEDNVASEDKTRMRQMLDFDKICQRLKKVSQFMIHYRVRSGVLIRQSPARPSYSATCPPTPSTCPS